MRVDYRQQFFFRTGRFPGRTRTRCRYHRSQKVASLLFHGSSCYGSLGHGDSNCAKLPKADHHYRLSVILPSMSILNSFLRTAQLLSVIWTVAMSAFAQDIPAPAAKEKPLATVLLSSKKLEGWRSIESEEAARREDKKHIDDKLTWPTENGIVTVIPEGGDIFTKKSFGDCVFHLNFLIPDPEPDPECHCDCPRVARDTFPTISRAIPFPGQPAMFLPAARLCREWSSIECFADPPKE